MKYALIAGVCIILLIPIIAMFKKGAFFKCIFLSAFQGLASLLAVNSLGLLTGVSLAVNWYTVLACVCLGIPASISMLVLDIIM